MSRRWSGTWGSIPARTAEPDLEVLVPTRNRPAELAVTLAGLAAQEEPDFSVIVSDQSEGQPDWDHPAAMAMVRVLRVEGRPVRLERHLPVRGLAEHRHFLVGLSAAARVLLLDDDVWLEPGALQRLNGALTELRCGFVGFAVQGLSYLNDDRPAERETFEPWQGSVRPEKIRPGSPAFARYRLHNAANPTHLAAEANLSPGDWLAYKIAWIGGCVLFDRTALLDSGGFDFHTRLPPHHAGEDVAAQWRVLERYGGAGILPSGAVHLEAPTTVVDRSVEAFDVVFPEA